MIIDVSSILKEFGGKIDINGDVKIPDTEFNGNSYKFLKPMHIEGNISNNGKTLLLDARCDGVVSTQCARCAKDLNANISFRLKEALMQGEKNGDDFEDIIIFEKHDVNIDEIVYNNFIINVPAKYLCKEDCKGLCPECGADLNEGECGCNHESIDPRWATLADMIKKNND